MKQELPYRQIHMDFHTSPFIPAVGDKFDPDEFADVLAQAHVNSINLFAKCHHGFYYYPSKIGSMHPHLQFDLFGAQLKACRGRGIRALAYTTAVWNEDWADRHPEWLQVGKDGIIGNKGPFASGFHEWRHLCLNNPEHRSYLRQELDEIQENYRPDGYWIDIIIQRNCICRHCLRSIKEKGLNPRSQEDMNRHDRLVEIAFMQEIFDYIMNMPGQPEVYFNGHPAEMDLVDDKEASTLNKRRNMTFIDIESLPSDLWGYTHFPIYANYLNKYEQEITMMNGKFHKAWGDFGSLRNLEALEYECFRALANGAKCCVGDQLHPSGQIDKAVYTRIGEVYTSIAEKEVWCRNTKKIAQIGVLVANKVLENQGNSNEGVYRMLSELHYLFDYVDFTDELAAYELLLIPDCVRLPDYYAKKIEKFIEAGGKLILTGNSGLKLEKNEFASDKFGVEYINECEYQPTYIRLSDDIYSSIPEMDYVLYEAGHVVKAAPGSVVLASQVDPYFNRSYEYFCSHRQTPPSDRLSAPAIVQNGSVLYISHPLFRDYAINGNQVYRQIIAACLELLLAAPMITTSLPATAEVTLRNHPQGYVMHVLHYIPQRKSKTIDIIDARIPLYNQDMTLRIQQKVTEVFTYPQNEKVLFAQKGDMLSYNIPVVNGHQMVIIRTG